MLHHGAAGRAQSKECYFMFMHDFVVFHQEFCGFIIFIIFFFIKYHIFTTNKKPELLTKKYHLSCMWYYICKKIILYLQKDGITFAKR